MDEKQLLERLALHQHLGDFTRDVISRESSSNTIKVEGRPEPARLPAAMSAEIE